MPQEPLAIELSRRLDTLLRAEAQDRGGRLPFDRFMEAVLYAPGLGYYAAGCAKLGAEGDFTTAPELSPLFGRCLAAQCREVLSALPGGDILEFGAGSGALAGEILAALHRDGPLPGRYLILEPSPDLRARQVERLGALASGPGGLVQWIDRLPHGFRGVVVANEVLDAMPVHRFQVGPDGEPLEVYAAPTPDGWEDRTAEPESPGLAAAVRRLQGMGLARAPGFGSELNLRLGPWLAAWARS